MPRQHRRPRVRRAVRQLAVDGHDRRRRCRRRSPASRSRRACRSTDATLTSDFGMRTHPVLGGRRNHKGIDLAAADRHAGLRHRRRRRQQGRMVQQLRQLHPDRAWRRAADPLRAPVGLCRRRRRAGPQGPADRLRRLDRPLDRPAPALRSPRRRRSGRSAPLHGRHRSSRSRRTRTLGRGGPE